MRYIRVATIVALLASQLSAADNWPDFRGPLGDGHAQAESLPLRWSETENVKWKTTIPGAGWSSPVVWGAQVWLTTAADDGTQLFAVCVDRETGDITHNVTVFDVDEPEQINPINTYASPSPVIEEGRVYVHFGTYGTACVDTSSGKVLWTRRDLKLNHKEGPGSSPILAGDMLVVHCDGLDVQYIIGLNKHTGETAWKTDRSIDLTPHIDDFRKAYSTPLLTEVNGNPQLISTAAHCAYGYDPATGRELWRVPYNGFSNVSRPVVGQGAMFLNTGYIRAQLWAVPLGQSGQIDDSRVMWKFTRTVPTKPSILLVNGLMYMVFDKGGVLTCLDSKTGEEVWTHRLGGSYSASPIYAAARIYFFDEDGQATVIAPGREYTELAINKLDEGCMASPAVAGESIILRTKHCLYRIGN